MSAARRLAAIFAADVVGYSRLTGADEEGTLERLRALRREMIDPAVREHHGRIVKTTGDGMLVEFASVVDAVRCAIAVQRGMAWRNTEVSPEKRIQFRVGINLGDVIAALLYMIGSVTSDVYWPGHENVPRSLREVSSSRLREHDVLERITEVPWTTPTYLIVVPSNTVLS
jgi:class 3 adenylate cyclase